MAQPYGNLCCIVRRENKKRRQLSSSRKIKNAITAAAADPLALRHAASGTRRGPRVAQGRGDRWPGPAEAGAHRQDRQQRQQQGDD